MRPTTRRPGAWLIAGLALIFVISACGSSGGTTASGASGGSGKSTITWGGFKLLTNAAVTVAEQKGYFAAQGLTIDSVYSNSTPATLQAVVSGDIDIAVGVPAVAFGAIQNGSCVKVLRPLEGAEYELIAQKNLHLDTQVPYPEVIKQLKGLSIGVPARGGGPETIVRTFMKNAGLNPNTDASFIAVGTGASAVTAFTSGKVQVEMATAESLPAIQKQVGYDTLFTSVGATTGPLANYYMTVAIANCSFVDSHPAEVMKFCKAMNQGYAALASDPTAGPDALVNLQEAPDQAAATSLWDAYGVSVLKIPALSQPNWQAQAPFDPPGIPLPSYSQYTVAGCATA